MLTLKGGLRLQTGRWLLLAMLASLHGAMLFGVDSTWVHPIFLAHLGVMLIWQPLWRGEREVGRSGFAFIIMAAAVVMFWLNWWVVAFWLTGLFGLVGGRVLAFRTYWGRLLNLSVMAYLLAVLLLWVVPHLFGVQSTIEVGRILMWYMLPVLLVSIAVLPVSEEPVETAQTIDFIYSLLLFMLLALVVLGSLAFMTLGATDYLEALLRTLFLLGMILLALGGLWNPRFGFSGLQVMFSRYLLNVGTPFESWLARLAEAAQNEPDATSYLTRATALLGDLPWLSGLSWRTPGRAEQSGQFSEHAVTVQEGDLHLTLYARQSLNPTVLLHIQLLAQLIGYFYQAKQREQSLRDITRLQTVYETGARLTHDLKNMLQSLLSLTAIAQSSEQRAQQLLQQQLPLLARRIELVLEKLQQSQPESADAPLLSLAAWWDMLRTRNQHQQIRWVAPRTFPDGEIPAVMFDCVLDNLLDNALSKRQSSPDIHITVEMHAMPLRITVCDSGEPVPQAIAANLLRSVVASRNGLGVGLYQAARWAEQLGYHLALTSNQRGKVCFELRG
ncbi:MAG: HAMP domain-containing histidine kinase [Nitrosomonadales bacterium]|nr:HAMP domain-containing histidine kinase [Nitrosomonadales bacterium]